MDRRGANCLSKAAGYTGIARVLVKAGSDGGKAQVKTKSQSQSQRPKPQPKPESVKALEPKPIPRPDPITPEPVSADDNKTSTENQLARLQKELLDGLMDLPEAEGQALAEEVSEVQQVAALMQARITQNWRRPPSARNGMEVLLEISLVPTGDVVGISVSSSSGSIAFDRSAIAAVERVAQFSEVAVLPISDFERYFRRFPLRFKPEDLRY